MKTADPLDIAADILDPPDWEPEGRPKLEKHQIPPQELKTGEADLWLLESGRGAGKTEACARYFANYMRRNAGVRGRIIAPTYDDAVESCIRGPSGLKSIDPEVKFIVQPGGSKVMWPNGSEALVLGTPFPKDVDRLRAGGNREIDWWEEMAANAQLKDAWDQAAFGLRLGQHPHAIASTTPRSVEAYREIRKMAETVLTKASMFDNPHLPKSFIKKMRKKYEGTRLGRQELYGELLEDVEGALWTRERIEASRVNAHPDLAIIVTAVDPAATSHDEADDTGIVVCGLGVNGHGYVMLDRTCHMDPEGWASEAAKAHHGVEGDYVVGEVNNGGEMVEFTMRSVDPTIRFKSVRASRGKATRAQPVSALWGNTDPQYPQPPEVHLVGGFPELEDQLCTWVPGEEDSPDRLDAMVWGLTELMVADDEDEDVLEYYEPERIGADI